MDAGLDGTKKKKKVAGSPVAYEDDGRRVAGVEVVHNSNDIIAKGLQQHAGSTARKELYFEHWKQACSRGGK